MTFGRGWRYGGGVLQVGAARLQPPAPWPKESKLRERVGIYRGGCVGRVYERGGGAG